MKQITLKISPKDFKAAYRLFVLLQTELANGITIDGVELSNGANVKKIAINGDLNKLSLLVQKLAENLN